LIHVFNDANFIFDGYKPIEYPNKNHFSNWDDFKAELKHDNRFFPKSFPERDELSNILSYLSIETNGEKELLYRARQNSHESCPYKINDMGPPPSTLASGGRANPTGIAYLYVASTIKTALSEVRPHNSECFTIAEFKVDNRLKLIDLRNPRLTISPFRYNEEELSSVYSGLGLLVKLGDELTKPVSQRVAHLEYLSSQYLCEFIKSVGYDGVIYKSSLGDGDNYAIFDKANLKGVRTRLFKISDVNIESQEIDVDTGNGSDIRSELTGSVKWFNEDKGFGFINVPEIRKDVFVHYSAIISTEKIKNLSQGQTVKLSIVDTRKGTAAAAVVPA
ncbi:MAG: cold shock domain-containing protein, partial [Pseudomonadales bacterium]